MNVKIIIRLALGIIILLLAIFLYDLLDYSMGRRYPENYSIMIAGTLISMSLLILAFTNTFDFSHKNSVKEGSNN